MNGSHDTSTGMNTSFLDILYKKQATIYTCSGLQLAKNRLSRLEVVNFVSGVLSSQLSQKTLRRDGERTNEFPGQVVIGCSKKKCACAAFL